MKFIAWSTSAVAFAVFATAVPAPTNEQVFSGSTTTAASHTHPPVISISISKLHSTLTTRATYTPNYSLQERKVRTKKKKYKGMWTQTMTVGTSAWRSFTRDKGGKWSGTTSSLLTFTHPLPWKSTTWTTVEHTFWLTKSSDKREWLGSLPTTTHVHSASQATVGSTSVTSPIYTGLAAPLPQSLDTIDDKELKKSVTKSVTTTFVEEITWSVTRQTIVTRSKYTTKKESQTNKLYPVTTSIVLEIPVHWRNPKTTANHWWNKFWPFKPSSTAMVSSHTRRSVGVEDQIATLTHLTETSIPTPTGPGEDITQWVQNTRAPYPYTNLVPVSTTTSSNPHPPSTAIHPIITFVG